MAQNYEVLNQFFDGMSYDMDNHSEGPKSYQYGLNGRLYSHDGLISFSSIEGTIEVFTDPFIKKYLGYWAFKDELIIFLKTSKKYDSSNEDNPIYDLDNYNTNLACDNSNPIVDYSNFYELVNYNLPNFQTCPISESWETQTDFDTILSIRKNELGELYSIVKWSGKMGWDSSDKIVTYGIEENLYYKRVYFTNNRNPFRVINLQDNNLYNRNENELSVFQQTSLLEPLIESIESGGNIKSSSVFYTYRLITENGQVSQFSPFSEVVRIVPEDHLETFEGGDISESTDKMVKLKIYIPSYENYKDIEVVAVEYEAFNVPTSIRSLGLKPVAPAVSFNHYGNEVEFSSNITIAELLDRKNSWLYCSTLNAKDNRLFPAGLRNNPLSVNYKKLQRDFALKSWDQNGQSFSCLLNPDPSKYKFITTGSEINNMNFLRVNSKIYTIIKSFGSTVIRLKNLSSGDFIEKSFVLPDEYTDIIPEVYEWLSTHNQSEFETKFPNLKLNFNGSYIVFSKTNPALNTEISNYEFSYSNTQIIEDYYEEYDLLNNPIPTNNLINGAVSIGFNKGNGIRLSFQTQKDRVMKAAYTLVHLDSKILHLEPPSLKKGFMKGEIYRPGILFYGTSGEELFTIPLGDIKVPELGDKKTFINSNGVGVVSNERYTNSSEEGTGLDRYLMAERTVLQAEVRISCEMKKYISAYKLVYVERDEINRTILCQGISGPMEKYNQFSNDQIGNLRIPEQVINKWVLPFNGGPTYDHRGFKTFDEKGENFSENTQNGLDRVLTHRSMMYFDSPDIIYGMISGENIDSYEVQRVERIKTDIMPDMLRNKNFILQGAYVYGQSIIPEVNMFIPPFGGYSRKIYDRHSFGEGSSFGRGDDVYIDGDYNDIPYMINLSIFTPIGEQSYNFKKKFNISHSTQLERGEIKIGSNLGVNEQISNNAMTLAMQGWFHAPMHRDSDECSSVSNRTHGEFWKSSNISKGYKTVIIKTEENFFTNDFIGSKVKIYNNDLGSDCNGPGDFNSGKWDDIKHYHIYHAVNNILTGREASIYGGRTDFAYSNNVYRSLSKTIPVIKEDNKAQKIIVEGDVYCTLYIRVKNDMEGANESRETGDMNSSGNCNREGCDYSTTRKKGAWVYGVVLETMVEPRLTYDKRFYRSFWPFDFSTLQEEVINSAYNQENNLKSYIPVPYNFKDDPNLNNIIAASEIKLNGDYIDNWSVYKVNNFYEVEKDKGSVHNLVKYLDVLYAVQERQTSRLFVNQREMIQGEAGEIAVQQGTGEPISDHEPISDYGTSIRRSVVQISVNSQMIGGFMFFDETKKELVKISQPILLASKYHLKMIELLKGDSIIDSEGYYDDEYKETVIRLRTKNNKYFTISYNEILKCLNGFYEYNNDIYINWNDEIFSPKRIQSQGLALPYNSISLHQLNRGSNLRLFSESKTIKIGVVINPEPNTVKIFTHWAGILNTKFPIKQISIQTSLGQNRIISGDHHRYKIREGRHSVPLKNFDDWSDLRGEWAYLEIEIEHPNIVVGGQKAAKERNKINLFSFINFVRDSYQ